MALGYRDSSEIFRLALGTYAKKGDITWKEAFEQLAGHMSYVENKGIIIWQR